MSFFDFLEKGLRSVAKSTANQRASIARDIERNNPNMSDAQRKRLDEQNRITERMAELGNSSVCTSSQPRATSKSSRLAKKSVEQWDTEWVSIGKLKTANLAPYNHCVGLYRHVVDGETKYVGRAIELNNGGFRKRLSDYRRDSDSARKHTSGRIIHEHLDRIETYILIVGTTEEAVEVTKRIEGVFVRRYNPEWNKMINI